MKERLGWYMVADTFASVMAGVVFGIATHSAHIGVGVAIVCLKLDLQSMQLRMIRGWVSRERK